MTRFARAKGSKGANEKVAEDATPWHIMKEQAAQLRATASANQTLSEDKQSTTNWKEELRKEELVQRNSNAVWAEFDGTKKKKRSTEDISPEQDRLNGEEPPEKKKKKRSGSLSEKKKDTSGAEDVEPTVKEMEQENNINTHGSKIKAGNDTLQKRQRKRGKNKSNKKKELDGSSKKKWEKKDGEVKRRKPEVNSQVWIINGRKVEVTMFDRFIVKKEDAERLKELGRQLKEKNVPQNEIQRTLKLERRRAEKALAREKKKVCFGCRQYGHSLAECTTSGTGGSAAEGTTTGTGLCFKCGSTEHKAFQCRVKQGDNFGFATCFICKEEGHIARQCPDNPRGLYPRGGGCRLCGDVTHLKKDCPTAVEEKESSKLTLGTIDAQTSLDDLDNTPAKVLDGTSERLKTDKKIIKF